MHDFDAESAAGACSDQPGPPGEITLEAAEEIVRQVIAWYNRQIMQEQRAASPDAERLGSLREQRQAAVADQQALQDAGPEQWASVAARYAARYRELRRP